MAETITITRLDVNDIKTLIAEKYGVEQSAIKCWNGKYEFPRSRSESASAMRKPGIQEAIAEEV